ncbi:MAG: two-component regulator propeller domain-containing protein [Bacteroidota bacterium]
MRRLALFVLLLWLAVPAWTQDPPSDVGPAALGRWQALTAFNEVRALAASPTTIWAATSGGVFGYTPASGEIERYTTVEGLASINPTALAYDADTAVLWVGHGDGALDRLDPATGLVQPFFDILRTDRFSARQIERLRVGSGVVYAATGFGIVVFDTERLEVRDSYVRLGALEAGTAVRDVLEAPLPDGTPGLWAATVDGIVRASQAANLLEPGAWTFEANSPEDASLLAFFQDQVVTGTGQDVLRRRTDGTWTRFFLTGSPVVALLVQGTQLVGLDPFSILVHEPGQPNQRFFVRGDGQGFADVLAAATLDAEGQLWAGDLRDGLLRFPALTGASDEIVPAQVVVPAGPRSNQVDDLDAGPDGNVWLATRRTLSRTTVAQRDGEGTWVVYTEADGLPGSSFLSALAAPDGGFWGGSDLDGLVRIDPDGAIEVFDTSNSTILSGLSNPDFVPIVDAALDSDGQIWALNQATAQPLHVRDGEGVWTGLPFPSNVITRDLVQGVLIDRFDQKWVFTSESGIFVYAPGSGLPEGSAPFIRPGGSGGIGLPNAQVQALAEDLDGRIWVGTRRGLATIFSPGSAFGGDASLIDPQWARTEDGASFFLRDLLINDIAVDPANNKWLASSSGAWLIDADGENVLQRFTAADSPLFSDNVIAVDVDAQTGVVYFATDRGVLSYQAEAVAAARTVRDLDVAPNPYRPAQHPDGVRIEGLLPETRVRILTVGGRLVRALDTRGGAVRWDGRDTDGQPVPSGVYLVAASGLGDEGTGFGKIAVIR